MGARRTLRRAFSLLRLWTWTVLVGPYCVATELSRMAISSRRPLRLSGEAENYPMTELLGRITTFQSRLRFARAIPILIRTLVICGIILLAARLTQLITHVSFGALITLAVFLLAGWGLHLALHHAIAPFEVARLIDRNLGLNAQIATAVEFTLTDRIDRPLARTQIRQATNRLRELDPRAAFPLLWPGRDARILATVVVAYGVTGVLSTMGVNLPRPTQAIDAEVARQAILEAQAPSPFVQMDAAGLPFNTTAPPLVGAPPPNSPLSQQLSTLQQQLHDQTITPQQYQQQLQQVQQQIAQQAQQSLAAQDALNALAASLKDASSTQGISNSLSQGNYDQAAQQLSDLSKQVPELSTAAQQELAQRFDQAAQQTKSLNPDISQASQQAANALKQGDTQQASQSLQDLSKAVQQAGQKVAGQSQLGQAMQNVQQQMGDQSASDAQASPSDQSSQSAQSSSADGSNSSNDASGQQSQANASNSSQGSGDSAQPGPGNDSGQSNSAQSSSGQTLERGLTKSSASSDANSQSDSSGGVGNTPGDNPLGGGVPSLDTHGVKVTVIGQPSNNGASSTQAGNRNDPLTASDGSTLNTAGGASAPPSNVPIDVHQDNNQVPIGMKPVVREYFSNGGN